MSASTTRTPDRLGSVVAIGLAAILLVAGGAHLVSPRPFDDIMPRAIPEEARRPLTLLSGVAELAIGALLLPRRTRRLAGRAAQALFVLVLPANVQAALDGGYPTFPGFLGSPAAAWVRLPLQLPLIWAGGIAARRARDGEPA